MCVGVPGAAGERVGEQRRRFLGPACLPQHHAERVGRLGQRGIETQGDPQRVFGSVEVVLLFECEAEIVVALGIRRVAARELTILRRGAGEVALLHERGPQIETGFGVIGLPLEHRAKRCDGLVCVASLHERQAEAVAGIRQRWIDGQRPPELVDRLVEVACRLQGSAELRMGGRELRGVSQGDTQIADGRVELTLLSLGDREIVPCLGVRRTQGDRAAEHRTRPVHLLRPPQRRPEMVLRVEERRSNRNRRLELGDRFVQVSLNTQDEPQPIVRFGQPG